MNYPRKLFFSLVALCSLSSFGMIRQSHVIYDNGEFKVVDGQQEQVVKSHFVDPLLRRMSPDKLKTFIEQGNRIRAIKLSNGEHRLQAIVPGNGGGGLGATIGFFLGKGAVEVVCHGAIAVTALIPFAGPGIATGLEITLAPVIEVASNTVGLAVGLGGAIATGPL